MDAAKVVESLKLKIKERKTVEGSRVVETKKKQGMETTSKVCYAYGSEYTYFILALYISSLPNC
jgi:hypothetical protein